ncbi:dual specificity protein kinase splB isoform X1 [Herrania umbratica]|uniref:Dual specificity protein kinase splB isoform X1 n=2 Tax=Herrania umbratica TaxID=108875 RepID=A0A6J1AXZ1_9ROSI|nr:dual specificity protein kinase splB isoform X1 [Herrania umbratica]
MASNTPVTSSPRSYHDKAIIVSNDGAATDRNVSNICVQTGEEFSTEFLRHPGALRRIALTTDVDHLQSRLAAFNYNQNCQQVCKDLKCIPGLRRKDSEYNSDVPDFVSGTVCPTEVDNKAYPDLFSRYDWQYGANGQKLGQFSDVSYFDQVTPGPTLPQLYVVESPQSHQPNSPGVTEGAFTSKMKFLCSFGGRILPRPSDGKLRYVGGETRIISIRKSLTWEELAAKTAAICSQPHTIKYQLPDEDLDSLISVCTDEDLHHMIEEYQELERNGHSQRLRLFLVSLGEPESPSSFEGRTPRQNDTDYQYVFAVNGMLDVSQNSNGQSLASQTAQLGNASDYSPSFHRDSTTSAHAFENKDYTTSSPNIVGMFSHPAAQLLSNLQIPSRSFNHSPPLSPGQVQQGDLKNSHLQFFVDTSCFDHSTEGINRFIVETHPCSKSYYMDATSYHDNRPHVPLPLMNRHHHNQHLLENILSNKSREKHFHNRSPSGDFIPYPLHSQNTVSPDRPMLKERTLSDSQLQGQDERYSSFLKEVMQQVPYNSGREKSPSLAMSTSSQEWLMQRQERADGKCQVAKHEIQTTFRRADSNENLELSQEKSKWIGWCNESSNEERKIERNAEVTSHNGSITDKSLPNLNNLLSASPPAKDLVGSGDSLFSLPVIIVPNSADTREHLHGYKLHIAIPESHIRHQSATRDEQHTMIDVVSSQSIALGSPNLQPATSHKLADQEPTMSGSNLTSDNASSTQAFLHGEGAANPDHKSVEVSSSRYFYQRSKYEDVTSVQSQPSDNPYHGMVIESAFIIEDVTSDAPLDIPSSSAVVPHIQDMTSDEIQSTRETKEEIESDYEDMKSGGKSADEYMNDAKMVEIESGIHGLQIIKDADIEELHELGSGTFGTVFYGKWRGTDVAIKRIKESCFSGRSSEQERLTNEFWREARILSKIHHPNVVAFYGVVTDGPGGTMATVTEYMVNGSLRNALLKKDRALDRRRKLVVALDAAFGMEYLHFKNIVHFDLKCDNLLVNLRDPQRPICKVGDFGLSRIKRNTLVSGGVRGTLPWMAPELLNGSSSRVSEKVDVFSFGIALWEILTGEEPYASMHCGAIIGGIVNNTLRPPIPERCDPEWRKLMEECWSFDPAARPSFTEITNRLRVMSAALQPKRRTAIR